MLPLQLVVNGVDVPALEVYDDIPRAVLVSLFSWRRAAVDDDLPSGADRLGWWGDSFADAPGDLTGSRLYLLGRAKLMADTAGQAYDYAVEALQWLVDDGVAASVTVTTDLPGNGRLSLGVLITQADGATTNMRFDDLWSFINV